ncbi:MAG TPA: hypothetical protein VGM92_15660 [Candidatus Kapabacteria bacterium]|jgi:hypothetical protein
MNKKYLFGVGIVAAAIAAFVWQYRLRFPFDDVFISFRYAEHLANGYGLVWNIGGAHTEGYTNFLFILLLAVVRLCTTHLLAAAQAIGVLSTIVTGMLIFQIASRVRNVKIGFLAAAFYFLTPLTWINALSGMETSVFVMLCICAICFVASHRLFLAFYTLFLATLTRPEGGIFAGIIFFVLFVNGPFQRKMVLRGAAVFLLLTALFALWKWSYFGYVLPNSFYVKVLESNSSRSHLFPGLQYVRLFVTSMVVLIVLTLGIRRWRNAAILISALSIAVLLLFYLFVLPLEGLYDRFLWPAFAMITILGAVGVHDLVERFHLRSMLVFAVTVVVCHLTVSCITPRTRQSLAAHEEVWDKSMGGLISELQSFPHLDSLRFAYGDAGYVVYKSGVDHIDLFGLNDTHIAHARSISERKKVLESEKPDILLLPIERDGDDYKWIEDAYGLARDSAFLPLAITEAFPYPLAWVINTNSRYYNDCRTNIAQSLALPNSYLKPAPIIR